jgi:hypothetical protein
MRQCAGEPPEVQDLAGQAALASLPVGIITLKTARSAQLRILFVEHTREAANSLIGRK